MQRFQLKVLEIQIKDFIIIILVEKYVNIFVVQLANYFLHTFLHFHQRSSFFCQTQEL